MDLWVVAAATGAGYIAKHWQNLTSKERETSTESFSFYSIHRQSESRNLLQQIRDQAGPLQRFALEQLDRDGFLTDGKNFMGVTSTSDNNSQRQVENYETYNLLSLTSYPPVLRENENYRRTGKETEGRSDFADITRPLRSKYFGNFLEPLDSLESSLRAQLYREYAATEEYAYSSHPSTSTQTVRPFLLTDGSRVISRASREFKWEMQLQSGDHRPSEDGFGENEMQLLSRRLSKDIRPRSRRFSMMRESARSSYSQGFPIAKHIFFLGMTVGIMSTVPANNREMENLIKLLEKAENLVQDLQEELEMKELLNVKELPQEGFESRGTKEHPSLSGTPNPLYTEQELETCMENGGEEPDDQKAESSEAMSKIEAELEAELERLELNFRASSLEKISDRVKPDPDSDIDASGTFTNHPEDVNYAVSPQELSLRLHKVIESRLEARIKELEAALENSQKRLQALELESTFPWKGFYGDMESSSQESQTLIDEDYNDHDSSL